MEPAEALGMMASHRWGTPFLELPLARPLQPPACRKRFSIYEMKYKKALPAAVRDAQSLREILDAALEFSSEWEIAR